MKISIIIPSYKPQGYIWECLDSIRDQTFPKEDYELILVLNGCKEPYYTQIKNYINQNLLGYNVNFIQTDTGGVSNARNIALDAAKGEYVTFIDDDDYISPKYLEELYKAASPDTVSLCYPYAFNDGEPEVQIQYPITKVFDEYQTRTKFRLTSKLRKYFSGPCMKLIPMSFIQERRYDVRFKNGEDSLFMFLISDKIKKLSLTSKDAIYYRRYRENSAVTSKRSRLNITKNGLKMISVYMQIYCNAPHKYNFVFFLQRLLGAIKPILIK